MEADDGITEENMSAELLETNKVKFAVKVRLSAIEERLVDMHHVPALPPSPSSLGIQENPPARQSHQTAPVPAKLPKLKVRKFGGNISKWQEIWDSFESPIDKNATLAKVDNRARHEDSQKVKNVKERNVVWGGVGEPVAIETHLGWVISGPLGYTQSTDRERAVSVNFVGTDSARPGNLAERDIQFLWDLGTLGIKGSDRVYEEFVDNITFNGSRYSVKFPWEEGRNSLDSNYEFSLARMKGQDKDEDPGFVRKMRESFYVDYLVTGEDDTTKAFSLYGKSKDRVARGGFKLRKWMTNDKMLKGLTDAEENHETASGSVTSEEETYAKFTLDSELSKGRPKVLGLPWDSENDGICLS
ncbi:hypothetical protein AWC38_SpisGene13530 [Stylophora pistillata]|uniref:Uncharacterized protein n=1 Tax=Stylophora pistillata TaxID=50429 RepID=A0A2B4RYU6_STYPI|nr:hypothetical protein AWC38_SpisGene13530 [Stylophora pistillata]